MPRAADPDPEASVRPRHGRHLGPDAQAADWLARWRGSRGRSPPGQSDLSVTIHDEPEVGPGARPHQDALTAGAVVVANADLDAQGLPGGQVDSGHRDPDLGDIAGRGLLADHLALPVVDEALGLGLVDRVPVRVIEIDPRRRGGQKVQLVPHQLPRVAPGLPVRAAVERDDALATPVGVIEVDLDTVGFERRGRAGLDHVIVGHLEEEEEPVA